MNGASFNWNFLTALAARKYNAPTTTAGSHANAAMFIGLHRRFHHKGGENGTLGTEINIIVKDNQPAICFSYDGFDAIYFDVMKALEDFLAPLAHRWTAENIHRTLTTMLKEQYEQVQSVALTIETQIPEPANGHPGIIIVVNGTQRISVDFLELVQNLHNFSTENA